MAGSKITILFLPEISLTNCPSLLFTSFNSEVIRAFMNNGIKESQ
jgi:hypothetical protein